MDGGVSVLVVTVSGGGTLTFRGSGVLTRDERGVHLRYDAACGDERTSAELHLGAGRALLKSEAAHLLLDPRRPTSARLEGVAAPLTVTTHAVRPELEGCAGTVFLHYTVASAGRAADTFRVTLTVEPLDKERTV